MKSLIFLFLTLLAVQSFALTGKELIVCPVSRSVDWIFQVDGSFQNLKVIEFDKFAKRGKTVYSAPEVSWNEATNFDNLIAIEKIQSMMVLNLHHHYQQDGSVVHVAELEFSGHKIPFEGKSTLEGCLKPEPVN